MLQTMVWRHYTLCKNKNENLQAIGFSAWPGLFFQRLHGLEPQPSVAHCRMEGLGLTVHVHCSYCTRLRPLAPLFVTFIIKGTVILRELNNTQALPCIPVKLESIFAAEAGEILCTPGFLEMLSLSFFPSLLSCSLPLYQFFLFSLLPLLPPLLSFSPSSLISHLSFSSFLPLFNPEHYYIVSLALNFWSSCFCLLTVEIRGVSHHAHSLINLLRDC